MEAQQCVQLTCTNRSIGLIALISPCPSAHLKMCYRASCCLSTRCAGGDAQPIHGKTGLTAGRAPARQFHDLTFFAGLVAFARGPHPIPFRTRPLNPSAPMVLWLKPRESRSPPGLPKTSNPSLCKSPPTRTPPRLMARGRSCVLTLPPGVRSSPKIGQRRRLRGKRSPEAVQAGSGCQGMRSSS